MVAVGPVQEAAGRQLFEEESACASAGVGQNEVEVRPAQAAVGS